MMMMMESSTLQDQLPQRADTFFASATNETVFWRPRFSVNTPLMQHVPFLFWLVGAVRPRKIAVCGSHDGVGLFTLCQAMDKLNIVGCCLGIGFWTNEEVGETGSVPTALRDHAIQLYDDLVHWSCESSIREALAKIAPGSLDVLFIDATNLPEGELPAAEEWLRPLHRDGLILVHGKLAPAGGEDSVLQTLSGGRSIILFSDEPGLAVLPLSDKQPARLRALLEVSEQGALPGEIELFFRRLGQGHLAVARHIELSGQNRKLTSSLSAVRRERDEVANAERELREAYETRSRKLSNLQAERFDRETQLTQLELQLADARATAEAAEAQISDLQRELDRARQSAAETSAELERERKTRFSETAALTAQLEADRQQHEKSLADARATVEATEAQISDLQRELDRAGQSAAETNAELERERKTRFNETAALAAQLEALHHMQQEAEVFTVSRLQQEIQKLKGDNVALSRRVEALMSSTSWRVTAPMRKVKSALSRN